MSVTEKVIEHLRSLPEPMQAEVLDFVEHLERIARGSDRQREDAEWSDLSLTQAMRGMESEPSLYSSGDLKESFA